MSPKGCIPHIASLRFAKKMLMRLLHLLTIPIFEKCLQCPDGCHTLDTTWQDTRLNGENQGGRINSVPNRNQEGCFTWFTVGHTFAARCAAQKLGSRPGLKEGDAGSGIPLRDGTQFTNQHKGGRMLGFCDAHNQSELSATKEMSTATSTLKPSLSANLEQVHDAIKTSLQTANPTNKNEPDNADRASASAQHAVQACIHKIHGMSPGSLGFQQDMLPPVPIVVNPQHLRKRQALIDQNNMRGNRRRQETQVPIKKTR